MDLYRINRIIGWAYDQHDRVCNQKYDERVSYSEHLRFVEAQALKFLYLLDCDQERENVLMACACHDLIEDARITYNDLVGRAGKDVAEIVYCCTELRGKNRSERHGSEYFETLSGNRLAVFVKMCDIIANVTYSILTNSTMLEKYRKEFPHLKAFLSDACDAKYYPMFVYLENIINLRNSLKQQ